MTDFKKGKHKRTVIDSSKPGGLMGHLAPECGCRKNKMLECADNNDWLRTNKHKKNTYLHTSNEDTRTRNTERTQHKRTYTQPWVEALWPLRCTHSEKQRSLSRACIQVCMNKFSSRKSRKQLPACHLRGDMSPFHLQSTLWYKKYVMDIGWKYVVPESRLHTCTTSAATRASARL